MGRQVPRCSLFLSRPLPRSFPLLSFLLGAVVVAPRRFHFFFSSVNICCSENKEKEEFSTLIVSLPYFTAR